MEQRGIPKGDEATFLSSIVLFTSRKILEEVGGFPLMGLSYREAVGCEIAMSRLIMSRGYRISRIKTDDLAVIGHRQWTQASLRGVAIRNKLRIVLQRLGLKRRPPTR
jgi:hypothetical protein